MDSRPPAFTCPTCGARSWHPADAEANYCGRCHAYGDERLAAAFRAAGEARARLRSTPAWHRLRRAELENRVRTLVAITEAEGERLGTSSTAAAVLELLEAER